MFLPLHLHVEHLGLEALAAAVVARHEHVGHEHHLDLEIARALAGLAAAAGDVEAERARACSRAARASGASAKMRRISSNAFTYVTGFERGDLPIGLWSMQHDVVDRLEAGERVVRADASRRGAAWRECSPVSCVSSARMQHVVHERALARSRDAGDGGDGAERDADVDALEVVLARAGEREPPRADAAPLDAGTGISRSPVRYCPVSGLSRDARHRAGEHELAALLAAARSELHHVVGGADRVEIVLDDEHGVAAVAQPEQQPEQAVHVARVQPDRRLVEHVERVDELRAERVGEPDALRLAAGERARRAIQREVVEPDVAEERTRSRASLRMCAATCCSNVGELERRRATASSALDRQLADLRDVAAGDPHLQRLGLELGAVAGRDTPARSDTAAGRRGCTACSASPRGRARKGKIPL